MNLLNAHSQIFIVIFLIASLFATQQENHIQHNAFDDFIIKSCEKREIIPLLKNLNDPRMKPEVIGHCVYLLTDNDWIKADLIMQASKYIKFHPDHLENALLKACTRDSTTLLTALLAAGADPSAQDSLPLVLAVREGRVAYVNAILTDPRVYPAAGDNVLYKSLHLMSNFREMWDHPAAPLKQLGAELLHKSLQDGETACLVDLLSHPDVDKSGIKEIAEGILLNGPQIHSELVVKTLPLVAAILNSEPDLTQDQYAELSKLIDRGDNDHPVPIYEIWDYADILIVLIKSSLSSTKYNLLQLLLKKLPPLDIIQNGQHALSSMLSRAISFSNFKAVDILLENSKFSKFVTILLSMLESVRPKSDEITEQSDLNGSDYSDFIIDELYSVADAELGGHPLACEMFKNTIRAIAADDALLLGSPLPSNCCEQIINYLG